MRYCGSAAGCAFALHDEKRVPADLGSCHDAMNVVSGGPDAAALTRRARARCGSRRLLPGDVASDDTGSSRHRCEPRPLCRTLDRYRTACEEQRIKRLHPRCDRVVMSQMPA